MTAEYVFIGRMHPAGSAADLDHLLKMVNVHAKLGYKIISVNQTEIVMEMAHEESQDNHG